MSQATAQRNEVREKRNHALRIRIMMKGTFYSLTEKQQFFFVKLNMLIDTVWAANSYQGWNTGTYFQNGFKKSIDS